MIYLLLITHEQEGIYGRLIEMRKRKWYAVFDVPKALRQQLKKRRYVESLDTESKTIALCRAGPLISVWKLEIERARSKPVDPIATP
jgi:hypothetical protein